MCGGRHNAPPTGGPGPDTATATMKQTEIIISKQNGGLLDGGRRF